MMKHILLAGVCTKLGWTWQSLKHYTAALSRFAQAPQSYTESACRLTARSWSLSLCTWRSTPLKSGATSPHIQFNIKKIKQHVIDRERQIQSCPSQLCFAFTYCNWIHKKATWLRRTFWFLTSANRGTVGVRLRKQEPAVKCGASLCI